MKLGDKVMRYVSTTAASNNYTSSKNAFKPEERILVKGTVCYVHPANRFYCVEFTIDGRTFRETYKFEGEEYNA